MSTDESKSRRITRSMSFDTSAASVSVPITPVRSEVKADDKKEKETDSAANTKPQKDSERTPAAKQRKDLKEKKSGKNSDADSDSDYDKKPDKDAYPRPKSSSTRIAAKTAREDQQLQLDTEKAISASLSGTSKIEAQLSDLLRMINEQGTLFKTQHALIESRFQKLEQKSTAPTVASSPLPVSTDAQMIAHFTAPQPVSTVVSVPQNATSSMIASLEATVGQSGKQQKRNKRKNPRRAPASTPAQKSTTPLVTATAPAASSVSMPSVPSTLITASVSTPSLPTNDDISDLEDDEDDDFDFDNLTSEAWKDLSIDDLLLSHFFMRQLKTVPAFKGTAFGAFEAHRDLWHTNQANKQFGIIARAHADIIDSLISAGVEVPSKRPCSDIQNALEVSVRHFFACIERAQNHDDVASALVGDDTPSVLPSRAMNFIYGSVIRKSTLTKKITTAVGNVGRGKNFKNQRNNAKESSSLHDGPAYTNITTAHQSHDSVVTETAAEKTVSAQQPTKRTQGGPANKKGAAAQ